MPYAKVCSELLIASEHVMSKDSSPSMCCKWPYVQPATIHGVDRAVRPSNTNHNFMEGTPCGLCPQKNDKNWIILQNTCKRVKSTTNLLLTAKQSQATLSLTVNMSFLNGLARESLSFVHENTDWTRINSNFNAFQPFHIIVVELIALYCHML